MNPHIRIGKLRNAETGKEYTLSDVRDGYNWAGEKVFTHNRDKYKLYYIGNTSQRPVPNNGKMALMNPPIWSGDLKESPVNFYSKQENGEVVIDIGKAAAQLYSEWGEGIYQVQRFPDENVHKIKNLFERALVRKK